MAATIVCRAVRPLMHGGRRVEAGETLKLEPLAAAMLLDSGRCELAHDADAAEVLAAKRADTKRAIAQAGRPWHGPRVSEPWQRIE